MEKSMSHELKALADQLCKEDFKCLSQGIGIVTRPKKSKEIKPFQKLQVPKVEEPNPASIDSVVKEQDKKKASSEENLGFYKKAEIDATKKTTLVKKLKTLLGWLFKKLMAWSLDLGFVLFSVLLVVLTYSFTKGVFDLNQEQWITTFFFRLYENVSLKILGLGVFALLLMYGLLFR